ncbi:MAG: DUF3880 domain-containing protein [Lachnospiraceae bacterium]|nr:DUF3880 domain-containing protein [Lachnospiraceae bacterium]
MKILFYRYNSIYEPDCLEAFKKFGIDVVEERTEVSKKGLEPGDVVQIVADHILRQNELNDPFLFVFSINFYPAISDICEKLNTVYACWSVDCPVTELFANQIKNGHNRVFLFDKTQYERIYRHNPECVYYLPLGTNVDRLDKTNMTINASDRKKFSSDISFVGSLYNEKNPLKKLKLTDKTRGFIDGIERAQLNIFGVNFIEDVLTDDVVQELKGAKIEKHEMLVEPIDHYVAAHAFIGMDLAEKERILTLNTLAKHFNVDFYTLSDTSDLVGVKNCGPANSLTEMPKIFNLSKINLNITMRPIQTGLSLRIFDVLGSGGFLISNYQAEIETMFTPGVDLETYGSIDELVDKCAYYLEHEDQRKQIALSGYNKVKSMYTVEHRMKQMIGNMLNGTN